MKKKIFLLEDLVERMSQVDSSVLCHDLETLPLTCIHFVREEICTQVGAIFQFFSQVQVVVHHS